ncbi:hypothetical protein, partial [uncultured Porphyromonas sp.]|uniref:hypothetical protein n=1 Tax=uncultured Porphyromonas sp. TaxID=159274 RepID=UPI00260F1C65
SILKKNSISPTILTFRSKVPRKELFSSSGGTFQFQGGNFSFPRRELFGSKAGTFQFQREDVCRTAE